jgi:hypothetical protein
MDNNYRKEILYSQLDYIQNQIGEIEKQLAEIDIKIKLKGGIFYRYIKCGKPKCRCVNGERHGPYPHLQWWDGEKIKTKYLNEKNYPIYREELEKNKLKKKLEQELTFLRKEEKKIKKLIR